MSNLQDEGGRKSPGFLISKTMRIIAKNHDYYDSALAFGHDENVVFKRTEQEYGSGWKKPLPEGYHFMSPKLGVREMTYQWTHGRRERSYDTNHMGREFSFHPFTVAFCGKLYPGIRLDSRQGYMGSWKSDYAYSFDAYVVLLNHFGIEFIDSATRKYQAWRTYGERKGSPRNEKETKEYFERTGEDHVEFFAEKRKPIVVYELTGSSGEGNATLRFNGELKKLSFYKVFDAYTAFQELDMFISGVMSSPGDGAPSKVKPKRPNPVDISDEDLRDKKGFDDMSFKKAPTKRR
jgi:hypothetical protein